jgi:general stress protein 26
MQEVLTRPQQLRKINELIKDIRVAMLTTETGGGKLRSRPMATQDFEFDGSLWFFVNDHSLKVKEINTHHEVNVSYMHPVNNSYLSLSGRAELVRDRAKIHEYWRAWHEAWFPQGKDDPELALLRVDVETAEYWDSPAGKMAVLWDIAKALFTE